MTHAWSNIVASNSSCDEKQAFLTKNGEKEKKKGRKIKKEEKGEGNKEEKKEKKKKNNRENKGKM